MYLAELDKDFELVDKDDEFGRKLQDFSIQTRSRARRVNMADARVVYMCKVWMLLFILWKVKIKTTKII